MTSPFQLYTEGFKMGSDTCKLLNNMLQIFSIWFLKMLLTFPIWKTATLNNKKMGGENSRLRFITSVSLKKFTTQFDTAFFSLVKSTVK